MSDLIFEDPPEQGRGGFKGHWYDRLAPVMDHPGKWVRLLEAPRRTQVANVTTQLKGGRGRLRLPPGRWDAVTRKSDNGYVLYVKYLGPEDES